MTSGHITRVRYVLPRRKAAARGRPGRVTLPRPLSRLAQRLSRLQPHVVDEERRLFYVGITRAQKRLTLSMVRFRTKWGQQQSSLPSPFLAELDRKHIEEFDYSRHMKTQVATEEKASFFADLRSMLRADEDDD